jgi:hypothetical protein
MVDSATQKSKKWATFYFKDLSLLASNALWEWNPDMHQNFVNSMDFLVGSQPEKKY